MRFIRRVVTAAWMRETSNLTQSKVAAMRCWRDMRLACIEAMPF